MLKYLEDQLNQENVLKNLDDYSNVHNVLAESVEIFWWLLEFDVFEV